MNKIGYALIATGSGSIVWRGQIPARIELNDGDSVTLRADFDRAGLVVPDSENPTHRMVEIFEIASPSETAIRGTETEMFDGEKVVVNPEWCEPE